MVSLFHVGIYRVKQVYLPSKRLTAIMIGPAPALGSRCGLLPLVVHRRLQTLGKRRNLFLQKLLIPSNSTMWMENQVKFTIWTIYIYCYRCCKMLSYVYWSKCVYIYIYIYTQKFNPEDNIPLLFIIALCWVLKSPAFISGHSPSSLNQSGPHALTGVQLRTNSIKTYLIHARLFSLRLVAALLHPLHLRRKRWCPPGQRYSIHSHTTTTSV